MSKDGGGDFFNGVLNAVIKGFPDTLMGKLTNLGKDTTDTLDNTVKKGGDTISSIMDLLNGILAAGPILLVGVGAVALLILLKK